VSLRVEENLGVDDALPARTVEVGGRQFIKVFFMAEHRHALEVEIKEVLEVAKIVGRAYRVNRRVGQRDAVLLRQCEHQLGLERALDMDV
jgi:hypothetical protein